MASSDSDSKDITIILFNMGKGSKGNAKAKERNEAAGVVVDIIKNNYIADGHTVVLTQEVETKIRQKIINKKLCGGLYSETQRKDTVVFNLLGDGQDRVDLSVWQRAMDSLRLVIPLERFHGVVIEDLLVVSYHGPHKVTMEEKKRGVENIVRLCDKVKEILNLSGVILGGDFNLPLQEAKLVKGLSMKAEFPKDQDDKDIDYALAWPKVNFKFTNIEVLPQDNPKLFVEHKIPIMDHKQKKYAIKYTATGGRSGGDVADKMATLNLTEKQPQRLLVLPGADDENEDE